MKEQKIVLVKASSMGNDGINHRQVQSLLDDGWRVVQISHPSEKDAYNASCWLVILERAVT